ncbi:adenylyltransferase/cytidyltransferase family protein [Actinoplanes sp. NPDC051343]|uniref:adenylyltransferase/cytidyltransferase family protein n=1 Tax=Actinoplanes sp. NPDC051343 TaxID=3363906 RepID=UPI0037925A8A
MTAPRRPAKASIVSGYFSPLHHGHLDLMEAARERSGYLIVVVNNDKQQVLKKGRVIQEAEFRARIIRALKLVDEVFIAVEDGPGIDGTFDLIRSHYPDAELEFCNGGDRRDISNLPQEEIDSGARNNIRMLYGIGGSDKADSSSRILDAMTAEG